jgi:hypothetical protein
MTTQSGSDKTAVAKNEALPGTNAVSKELLPENIQDTLDFIDDFFSNYYGEDKKVPFAYLKICKEEIKFQMKSLTVVFQKETITDKEIPRIIFSSFQQFIDSKSRVISYSQLTYKKELLNQLLTEASTQSTSHLRETLYFLNYNEDNFIAHEYSYLKACIENLSTKKEKITALKFEQKAINQFPIKLSVSHSINMLPLKQQINNWIDEEIKYLETDYAQEQKNSEAENENKIHTSLSVAKLALIIRLLVVDRIIINKKIAPMLRVAARLFTSLQKEDISFGSLESKYHTPDKATINYVKEMLQKWIGLLNRL